MVVMSTWTLFSFEIPLVIGGIREGLVIQLDERWGEIAPLPGRSKETRNQALNQLLQIFCEGKVKGELFPSVQFGLECTLLPMRAVTAPLYAFLQGSPEEILTRAENAYARGYHVAKIKISSLSVEDAVELIHALTDRFRLRVDCNRAFSFDQAVALFSRVDPRQLDYVEDPTYETERLADFPFPFALDEMDLSSSPPFSAAKKGVHPLFTLLKSTISTSSSAPLLKAVWGCYKSSGSQNTLIC
jgi:O-succinylbenzoate synthase